MAGKKLKLQIITPERQVLDKEVDFVALPAYNGEMGVLPGHVQYVAKLNYGVLRYKEGDKEETFAVTILQAASTLLKRISSILVSCGCSRETLRLMTCGTESFLTSEETDS